MIIISYGMPKSASTYLFQITRGIAEILGSPQKELLKKFSHKKEPVPAFMNLNSDVFNIALESNNKSEILVIKTHSQLYENLKNIIKNTDNIICFSSFRDPLDIIVSLYECGISERKRPKEEQRETFSTIFSYEDAEKHVDEIIKNAATWLNFTQSIAFSYKNISQNPYYVGETIYKKICDQLGKNYEKISDIKSVIDFYENNKSNIWEYNIGGIDRYKTIFDDKTIERLEKKYNEFRQRIIKLD
jgi:hypothetical protein